MVSEDEETNPGNESQHEEESAASPMMGMDIWHAPAQSFFLLHLKQSNA